MAEQSAQIDDQNCGAAGGGGFIGVIFEGGFVHGGFDGSDSSSGVDVCGGCVDWHDCALSDARLLRRGGKPKYGRASAMRELSSLEI